ncbi:type IV secretion system protein [Ancylobacter oerskovii]|uniref:Type IV secretion system protein n=1 Tax=Ancylobacter oerskovii TaxID=459519 RepID=A0ABW4Z5T3_9HYPH|nr:type IV secretion system protein [Ancylobacter oerskovii]MBS7545519.1 type IV secretion system protein [Ancylobacter oerskovii]
MSKMKGLAMGIALALGSSMAVSPAMASGVPTVDVAAIAQMLQQFMVLQDQLKNMKSQLEEAQKQVNAMTGTRGMENVLKGENRNVIPTNWQETLAVMNGGEITGLAKSIRDNASRVDTAALDRMAPALRELSEGWANSAASEQAAAGTAYNSASERFARLQSLMDAIPQATDMKAIADLQARIQVEQVMLENESIKMQALAQAAASQRRLEERQSSEAGLLRSVDVDFGSVVGRAE